MSHKKDARHIWVNDWRHNANATCTCFFFFFFLGSVFFIFVALVSSAGKLLLLHCFQSQFSKVSILFPSSSVSASVLIRCILVSSTFRFPGDIGVRQTGIV